MDPGPQRCTSLSTRIIIHQPDAVMNSIEELPNAGPPQLQVDHPASFVLPAV
jgi:hypothetical protein